MTNRLFAALASVALLSGFGAVADAKAPCRDAKGKFVKCPDKPKSAARCRNGKGQFAKCGTAGAVPVK